MSDSGQEQGKGACSTETSRFWVGVSIGILFVFSAANIFVLFLVVPKFEQIYADALPGMPLPTITNFIITARIALAIVALGWPILGTVLIRQQKPYAILWINVGIIWCFLQIGITLVALCMPMCSGIIVGMSDVHP